MDFLAQRAKIQILKRGLTYMAKMFARGAGGSKVLYYLRGRRARARRRTDSSLVVPVVHERDESVLLGLI